MNYNINYIKGDMYVVTYICSSYIHIYNACAVLRICIYKRMGKVYNVYDNYRGIR